MPDPTIKLPPTPALRAALVVGMDLAASGEADGFDVRKCAAELLEALAQPHNGDCRQIAGSCLACSAHEAFAATWEMWPWCENVPVDGITLSQVRRVFCRYYPCKLDEAARAIVWLERTCAELEKEQGDG